MKNKFMVSVVAIFLIMAANSNANVADTGGEILAPARLMSADNDLLYADFSQEHNQVIYLAGDREKQGLRLGQKIVGDAVKKGKKVGKALDQTVKGIGRKKNKESGGQPTKGSSTIHKDQNNRVYEGQGEGENRSDDPSTGRGYDKTLQ